MLPVKVDRVENCFVANRVLEVIIEEQVEKLQATLRGIETLSVVARHTASKLTELISSEEVCTVLMCPSNVFKLTKCAAL